MRYYSIGVFASKIVVTIQTLRNWDKNDTLKLHHITGDGTGYYYQERLNRFIGLKMDKIITEKTIGYCRVSFHKQKDD